MKGIVIVDMTQKPLLEGIDETRENFHMVQGLSKLNIENMDRKELEVELLRLAKSKPMVDFVRTNMKPNPEKPG